MMKLLYLPQEQPAALEVGGKAAQLCKLVGHGFQVPAFLMIPPDAFAGDRLKAEAIPTIGRQVAKLGNGPFAVRSSAVEEDGAAHSHAGQFLSLLNVTEADWQDAAARVWQSGAAESVKSYRAAKGLDGQGGGTAVIIQKQVAARAAGVLFTADPVRADAGRVVISAIARLGDRLVSGEADGDDYVLAKGDGRLLEGPDQGVLSASDLKQLHALAVKAETDFAAPQDMEWAFDGDELFVLQSRPITTLIAGAKSAANPDPAILIFDNSNIIESYPGVVAPLTYSFAQYAYARVYRMFVRMIGVSEKTITNAAPVFENMLGRLDGRVYYNLINWYRVLAMLPGFALNRAHMETMMGVSEPLPDAIADRLVVKPATLPAKLGEYGRILRGGGLLMIHALMLRRTIARFYKRLDAALARPAATLDSMPLSELAQEYRRIEVGLLDRWDAPLINDFLCMMAFGASRKLMGKWAGEAGLRLHSDILIGQGDIVSAEPARLIREMGQSVKAEPALIERLARGDATVLADHQALAARITAYLDKFSDRCTEELKLESLSLHDDMAPLLKAIAAAARNPITATARSGDPLRQLAQLFAQSPLRGFIARRLMNWTKKRVRDRENLRFERTRIFGRARKLFLCCGKEMAVLGLIEAPRDVIHLTVQEVLGAIEGFGVSTDLKGLIRVRKSEMDAAARRADPPERVTLEGSASLYAGAAKTTVAPQNHERERRGTGCSAGLVTAAARVITDPRRETLLPGEILVARHTDPGWIATFANASAIVVERGSLLSHSAIVARELGIPCVVGIKGAMQWVVPGERLTVDGASGLVRKAGADE